MSDKSPIEMDWDEHIIKACEWLEHAEAAAVTDSAVTRYESEQVLALRWVDVYTKLAQTHLRMAEQKRQKASREAFKNATSTIGKGMTVRHHTAEGLDEPIVVYGHGGLPLDVDEAKRKAATINWKDESYQGVNLAAHPDEPAVMCCADYSVCNH